MSIRIVNLSNYNDNDVLILIGLRFQSFVRLFVAVVLT